MSETATPTDDASRPATSSCRSSSSRPPRRREGGRQTPPQVERRVPWVTSRPGRPRLGRLQRAEGRRVRPRLRRPRPGQGGDPRPPAAPRPVPGYGFVPHYGQQSFLVPLATAHLPAFEPHGPRLRDEIRQKMTAHADRFDPDEADWIARRLGHAHQGARHAQRHRRRDAGAAADARRADRPAAEPGGVRRGRGAGGRAAAERPHPVPEADRRLDRLLGRRGDARSPRASRRTGNLDLQAKKLGVFVKVNNELLRFA